MELKGTPTDNRLLITDDYHLSGGRDSQRLARSAAPRAGGAGRSGPAGGAAGGSRSIRLGGRGHPGRAARSPVSAAVALGIPLVLVRDPELTHALKELDALASVTVENLAQAAEAIAYIFE